MIYSPLIEKAIRIASYRHRNQNRKYPCELPSLSYVSHLFSVALILARYADDENIIAGGILHDIIEDTDYTIEELESDFGTKIKDIVLGVTEKKLDERGERLPWEIRKKAYSESLKNASPESLMICAADKIHNMNSYINYDKTREDAENAMWSKFNASKELKIKTYGDVLEILKKRLNNPIVKECERMFCEMKRVFKVS